jgi:AcrR family transcriptional regulator
VELILTGVDRALDHASILRAAAPRHYSRERVELAVADVIHRVLFGLCLDVNTHGPGGERPPGLRLGGAISDIFERVESLEMEAKDPGRRALASILKVGDDVVVGRGYRGIRVDDVIEAAGVSHGSFYTYFENIDDFIRVVAVRAVRDVSAVLRELPPVPDRVLLRRWLRRYNAVHSAKGPMIRIWVEAVGEPLRDSRPAVFDWGRRHMARLLAGREFGDVDLEALVLLALVEVFGSVPTAAGDLDAAVLMIERGFFGHDGPARGAIPRRASTDRTSPAMSVRQTKRSGSQGLGEL